MGIKSTWGDPNSTFVTLIHEKSGKSFMFFDISLANQAEFGDIATTDLFDNALYIADSGEYNIANYDFSATGAHDYTYYSPYGSFDETFHNVEANSEWTLKFTTTEG